MPYNESTDSKFVDQVCTNTKTAFIEITEDKLEIILIKFFSKYNKSKYWLTLFPTVLTILITILTADFNNNFLNISKEIWTAIFYIGLFISIILLLYSIIYTIVYRNEIKIKYLLKTIKNN